MRNEGDVMSATSPTWRDLIARSAVIGALGLLPEHFVVAAESNAIRPFPSTFRKRTSSISADVRVVTATNCKGDTHERLGYCPPRHCWYRQHRSRPTAAERARHDERHE